MTHYCEQEDSYLRQKINKQKTKKRVHIKQNKQIKKKLLEQLKVLNIPRHEEVRRNNMLLTSLKQS